LASLEAWTVDLPEKAEHTGENCERCLSTLDMGFTLAELALPHGLMLNYAACLLATID